VCRFGGEEFVLVLPHVTQDRAAERAEELRHALEATLTRHGAAQITLTASFGVASYPHDGRTCGELVAAADRALCAAESAGRNRVHVSSPGGTPACTSYADRCSRGRETAQRRTPNAGQVRRGIR